MLPEITEEMEDRRVVASAKEGTAEDTSGALVPYVPKTTASKGSTQM